MLGAFRDFECALCVVHGGIEMAAFDEGPAEPSPELRIPRAAAQTRVVSVAGIRLRPWESARAFKGIICDDVSEFESHMPSQAVASLWVMCRVGKRATPEG